MSVELRRNGLHLTGTPLSLDAKRKSPLSFVSHGHADHIARHERTIATAATLRFMAHRLGPLSAPLAVPYRRPFELGPLVLELLPAGHILGSAQLRVIRSDGRRIVYTGDLNVVPSLTAEATEVAECDTLVIESTFGHPRYRFPPRAEVLGQVESWVRAHLERGAVPVLLGYPLGKSQEAMKYLASRGFRLVAHDSIYEMAELYAELGMPVGNVRRYEGAVEQGEVLFFPPHKVRGGGLAPLWPRATAVLTGWAMDPGAARRYSADVAFPVSDHADFPSLVAYAKATGASEVVTCHGFADELAQALRDAGLDARALGKPQQLALL
ncbi:MBL fold metallo-hydrolase [Corallococcus sp. M34]|uniref:MBL fold metallo-hydrolase n=1 Tax=Citreicoccus inhibens TaxID=2849499 RepID=UPI001C233B2F|nr:MBL fold metallo-hydrolase [Citreicoccus inhibens]MBU8896133.1 MBL fold metallo-hydrolase [Citreicoccus inhibens]